MYICTHVSMHSRISLIGTPWDSIIYFILTGGLLHSLTMTADYQSVHILYKQEFHVTCVHINGSQLYMYVCAHGMDESPLYV